MSHRNVGNTQYCEDIITQVQFEKKNKKREEILFILEKWIGNDIRERMSPQYVFQRSFSLTI